MLDYFMHDHSLSLFCDLLAPSVPTYIKSRNQSSHTQGSTVNRNMSLSIHPSIQPTEVDIFSGGG